MDIFCLNPACSAANRYFESRYQFSLFISMHSCILVRVDVSAVGRYDDSWSLGLPGLRIGMTTAFIESKGKLAFVVHRLL